MPAKPVFHRTPLMDAPFAALPFGAVRPEGWLREQLLLQSGAMRDAFAARWPDLGDPAAWSAPREMDARDIMLLAAALPLGHLLEDDVWIGACRRRVAWILESQREDGCLTPWGDGEETWRARAVLAQILTQYYAVTADKQILVCLLRYCKYALEGLRARALEPAAAAGAGELLLPALWLYRVTGKAFLLELAHALRGQGVDWTAFCHTMPLKTPMEKQSPWRALREGMASEDADARKYHALLFERAHAVSLARGLKTPALIAQWTGGIKHAEAFDIGYAKLMRYHGLANGMFSGDDLLGGASPSRAIHSAAVSELMTTLAILLAAQGRATHGDLLEKLAYNALPAAYRADMRAWQRVQQPNQVDLRPAEHGWYSAGPGDGAFVPGEDDAETLALHHGFPRFAASLWMASQDGGLVAMAYAPCSVRARAGNASVRVEVRTAYPYGETVTMRLHARGPVRFPLRLRIPDWAQGASLLVAGEEVACRQGEFAIIAREWRPGDVVTLTLPMRVALSEWYHGSGALTRGPLLLAHAPAAGGEAPDVWPREQWAYALLPQEGSLVRCDASQAAPFGQGRPLIVEVKAAPLPGWRASPGSAAAPPISPEVDRAEAVTLALTPYGATALRICQFPIAK